MSMWQKNIWWETIFDVFLCWISSTSLSGGNLVDDLPPVASSSSSFLFFHHCVMAHMYHILPQRGVGAPHFDARCAEEADIRSIRAVLPQDSRYSSIAQYFDEQVVAPLPKTKTFANSMFAFPRYHHHTSPRWTHPASAISATSPTYPMWCCEVLLQLIQRDVARL